MLCKIGEMSHLRAGTLSSHPTPPHPIPDAHGAAAALLPGGLWSISGLPAVTALLPHEVTREALFSASTCS